MNIKPIPRDLQNILISRPTTSITNYKIYRVNNKEIYEPEPYLKSEQQIFARSLKYIYNRVAPPISVAYRPKFNIVDAIKPHLNNPYWRTLDIEDFFGNISLELLYNGLSKMPLGFIKPKRFSKKKYIALILGYSLVNTEQGLKLPKGSPISPILSNIAMYMFDCEVLNKISLTSCYTRYCDDIIISSQSKDELDEVTKIITDLLSKINLKINTQKVKTFDENQWPRKVLGIVVHKDNRFTIGKSTISKIRGMARYLIKFNDPDVWNQLCGYLSIIYMIGMQNFSKSLKTILKLAIENNTNTIQYQKWIRRLNLE